MTRIDGRSPNQLRPLRLTVDYLDYAEGSVLIETGNTRVLCAASVEEKVPPFLEGKGQGWVTTEYNMLPRATNTRNARERSGKISGRTQEIQRLIGRSLRAAVDMQALGERTVRVETREAAATDVRARLDPDLEPGEVRRDDGELRVGAPDLPGTDSLRSAAAYAARALRRDGVAGRD